jgi:transcriptional regulator with XRE-family HTH domain
VQNGQLRAQRKLRGWSQEDLVRALVALGIERDERQLGVSRSQISRWEQGVNEPRAPYPKLLCQLFNATADELGLVPPSRSASASITMEGTTIEDGGDDVERRDFLRVAGRATVTGFLAPGLLRRVGAAAPSSLMEEALPLEAALSITDHYRLVLDSYPANDLMAPVLTHLQFVSQLLDSSTSRATQIQLATAASEAAGFVSRLVLDLNDQDGGWRYHHLAVAYAERAENPVLQVYHLTDMSLRVGILHEGELAVRLAERANSVVPKQASPGLQAWLAGRAAGAYSRVGDESAALHALDQAEAFANRVDANESPWPWTQNFGQGSLHGYRGSIAARLKLPEMAIPALQAALRAQNPGRIDKYRALALGDLAMSHLPEGEVEESVRLTAEAFDIGSQLGSYRVLQRVREVRSCLNPYRDVAAVRDLDERMAGV